MGLSDGTFLDISLVSIGFLESYEKHISGAQPESQLGWARLGEVDFEDSGGHSETMALSIVSDRFRVGLGPGLRILGLEKPGEARQGCPGRTCRMSLSEMLYKPVRNEEFRVSGERFVDFTSVFIAFGAHSKEQLLEVLKTAKVAFFYG